ncbi:MAG: class I tRNA ligase family protein, partial [Bacteroidota bacterium]
MVQNPKCSTVPPQDGGQKGPIARRNHRDILRAYALLLAPFAPHLGEELWSILGFEPSIHHAPFPVWN